MAVSLKCCGPRLLAASGGSQASSGFGQTGLAEAGPDKRGIRPSSDDEPGNRMVAWLSAMSGIRSLGEIAPRCIAGQPFIDMVAAI
ncbi:MAG: hypothetical protein ACXU85_07160, partial [Xanthobacteraceae bacterium]